MRSINPTINEALEELGRLAEDRSYFGTFSVALQGGRVVQVRSDQVLATYKREREDTFRYERQSR